MDKLIRKAGRAIGAIRKISEMEDGDFIREAIARFETAVEAERDQRRHELECLRMCDPDTQWDPDIKAQRASEERPCMSEDRINPFVLQTCNALKQNRASVTVNPVDDKSDPETAEVIQGLIRHITYESSADMAYDIASTSCVRVGRGFYRVVTEYDGPDTFDQVIRIKSIPNHHMVYVDPNAVEPDYSDAQWVMIEQDMTREEFEREYPDAETTQMGIGQWQSIGDEAPGWITQDGTHIRIVEYFYKNRKVKKICRLSDGTVIDAKDLPEGVNASEGSVVSYDQMGSPLTVDAVRESVGDEVKWCKLSATEVLERTEYAGTIIPIVPVLGKELNINGSRRYFGLISGMIDPQKRFNWLLSAQLETINLVPRAPFMAVKGTLVNPEDWAKAHRRPISVLYYEDEVNGKPVNPPQRSHSGADISAVNQALMNAAEGLKGTSGLYNPSIGATETTSQSGIAIRAQQAQGDMSTYHFQDAVNRARRAEGRIILDLIPHYYDSQRVLRIVNDDDTAKTIEINSIPDETDPKKKPINLTVGKYDLTVTAGPSYSTRRQENMAISMSMLDRLPKLGDVAGDLILGQMDVPIAKEMAKRYKTILPPGMAKDDKDQGPDPQQLMAQHQQSQQMIEQLTEALRVAQDEREDKQLERENKLEIARIQAQANVTGRFIQSESTQLAADSRALLDFDREIHRTSLQTASKPIPGQPGMSAETPARPAEDATGEGVLNE